MQQHHVRRKTKLLSVPRHCSTSGQKRPDVFWTVSYQISHCAPLSSATSEAATRSAIFHLAVPRPVALQMRDDKKRASIGP